MKDNNEINEGGFIDKQSNSLDWTKKIILPNIAIAVLVWISISLGGYSDSLNVTLRGIILISAGSIGKVFVSIIVASIVYLLTIKTRSPVKFAVISFWVVTAMTIMGSLGIKL